MSTRSYIIVRVPKHMIGKTVKFDASKLPVKVGERDWDENNNRYIKELEAAPREPLTIEHEYLRIFHHWDGYPDGLGAELLKNYKTLDDVLNLIAGGDIESCIGHYIGAAECGEPAYSEKWWEGYMADQTDTPCPDECYSYLFEDGEWKIYNLYYDHMKKARPLRNAVRYARRKRNAA